MSHLKLDPITRIEGHLKFETNIENGVVTDAKCSAEMYRGIEKALIGYDARVAGEVSQRICGFCPYSQTEAAALALEAAMGIKPNHNGQLLRNLIVGAYQVSDYFLHFYIASALDFLDIEAILQYDSDDESMIKLKNWNLSLTWTYGSGKPYTKPEGQYYITLLNGTRKLITTTL